MRKFRKGLAIARELCAWSAEHTFIDAVRFKHTLALVEDTHWCFPLRTLPVLTPQASQHHHWDEAKPSTHRWKPARVHLHKQAAGWPSVEEDGQAGSHLSPAPPLLLGACLCPPRDVHQPTCLDTEVPPWCQDMEIQEKKNLDETLQLIILALTIFNKN